MPDLPPPLDGDRLAKVIARAGVCSRRDAEGWIKDGRISVNGKVVRTPAFNVGPKDVVSVDGKPLQARAGTRLWLYHKPPGLVVTEKDTEGRETVFEQLTALGLPRVLSVGRLDINTEGLLLLTNDGGLKRVLELPATGWMRRYRVRAFGSITQEQLDTLKDGIEVEGLQYGPIEATLERQQGANAWLLFGLREGKNREVKNVLASLGLQVNRLIRVSYGPFQLGELPMGQVEVVPARVLREQLGRRLAKEAGVDFDSEMPEVLAQKRRPAARTGAPAREGVPERPARTFKPRGERPDRSDRPERDARPAGGKPRPFGPRRDTREGGRAEGTGERGKRFEGGDRKSFGGGDRKPFGGGKFFGDRKPFGAGKPFGDRKPSRPRTIHFEDGRTEKVREDVERDERPGREDRPFRARREGDAPAGKPRGPRPFKPGAGKPGGDGKPFRPKGHGFRGDQAEPAGDRPVSSRPFRPKRTEGAGPRPARSGAGGSPRSSASRPSGGPRPGGSGRPSTGGKPRPPRKPRA